VIDQRQRLETLVKDAIADAAVKLASEYGLVNRDTIAYEVGHSFGLLPIPGQADTFLGPVWVITLTMRNPLIGYTDLISPIPIPGNPFPGDAVFRQATYVALEGLLKQRAEALKREAK
jgi:hypothetical protein